MNILLLTAHSIAEYDDLRMFTDIGYDVFSIGAYSNPHAPGDDKRPALPQAGYHKEFAALTADQMASKENLPDAIIDWADAIVCHHYPERWIYGQWARIKHKRVIWRTCGQSNPVLEDIMRDLRAQGLQIVRYSPKEAPFFRGIGHFAGQDAMIRFGKYPSDYPAWTGEGGYIANVTQNMADRGQFCGFSFYLNATAGLDARPAGPGSEALPGGVGPLPVADMYGYLSKAGAYLYTGTFPASYTLGLIEAGLVGVPVVSIGPEAFGAPGLFEGHELSWAWSDKPESAREAIGHALASGKRASVMQQGLFEGFRIVSVGQEWKEFLS